MPFTLRAVSTACLAAVSLAVGVPSAGAQGAAASPVAVFESDEVTLRLVAAAPDAEGVIRAALLVDLAPGWKTYWIDPGEAGVPPRIDLSSSTNASPLSIAFPAPHRFGDDYGMSNGYSEPMAVALTVREDMPGERTDIRASVMLGVCEIVCIPVSADLALDPSRGSAADRARVDAAFAALPTPGTAADGITGAALSDDGKTLLVSGKSAAPASGPAPDLFVAGPKGWYFGKPASVERNAAGIRFGVPVLERPRKASGEALAVDAVMTVGDRAVEARAIAVSGAKG